MACLRWRNKCEDSNSEVTGTYRNRDKMEKHIAKIGTPKWRTHWINGQYWVMTVNTQEKHKFNEVNPIIIHPQNHHNISYIFIYRCYKHHPPKIGLWLGSPHEMCWMSPPSSSQTSPQTSRDSHNLPWPNCVDQIAKHLRVSAWNLSVLRISCLASNIILHPSPSHLPTIWGSFYIPNRDAHFEWMVHPTKIGRGANWQHVEFRHWTCETTLIWCGW